MDEQELVAHYDAITARCMLMREPQCQSQAITSHQVASTSGLTDTSVNTSPYSDVASTASMSTILTDSTDDSEMEPGEYTVPQIDNSLVRAISTNDSSVDNPSITGFYSLLHDAIACCSMAHYQEDFPSYHVQGPLPMTEWKDISLPNLNYHPEIYAPALPPYYYVPSTGLQ